MQLCHALEEKKIDVRLRDRHLAEGKLSQKDMEQALKSLPDDKENMVELGAESNTKK